MSARALIVLSIVGLASSAIAQTSASYKLTEQVINAGGHPAGGAIQSSASYHIKLDAIGEAVVQTGGGSASYHLDASFTSAYPPAGEVRNLRWQNRTTLRWDAEKSIGKYELYRDLTSTLPGNYGTCLQSALSASTATDASTPGARKAYFYLVTARNRLNEEGTKGNRSNGSQRPNPLPCP